MSKSLGQLVGGALAFWLVVTFPARWAWGESALVFSTTALLICLVPALATLFWIQKSFHGTPEHQLVAALGGTGLRMVFVIAAGMLLYQTSETYNYQRFWLWLVGYYLVTLALEVTIAVRQAPVDGSQPK